MNSFAKFNMYGQNFKCFGGVAQGFNMICHINLIIGRNNTGKSSLLDLVRHAVHQYDTTPYMYRKKHVARIFTSLTLEENVIRSAFPENISSGSLPGANDFEYGKTLIGATIEAELGMSQSGKGKFVLDRDYMPYAETYLGKIAKNIPNPFNGCHLSEISSERDIVEEVDSLDLALQADGSGATNILQRVLNESGMQSDLIEINLLNDLNTIMGPDAHFSRIATQRLQDGKWVIFLDEKGKGRVSLSDSGSGLKTILLVLLNMLVLPKLESDETHDFVFAFEELENNLHPGLQRRLLTYIRGMAEEQGSVVFLTTHSPVVIDIFSHEVNAQILHVTHDGEAAIVHQIVSSQDGHRVLEDLDVRASDLLQTNGIIWVEGISDVIYLRRWIVIFCESRQLPVPIEGTEFAFMEYGGRCLSHYDFSSVSSEEIAEKDVDWLIPALSVSRHSYLVMDSDRKGGNSKINKTKECAIDSAGGSWITYGREIENYLPPEVSAIIFGRKLRRFESASAVFTEQLNKTFNKKEGALKAVRLLNNNNWKNHDLEDQIGLLVEGIRGWNPSKDN